jgi:hypothetical protein
MSHLEAPEERNIPVRRPLRWVRLGLIVPVHSADPIPNCLTANVEIIIAQIPIICAGNFDFLSAREM